MNVIILAAGKGTRMKSNLPKVLHKIADKPMLHHVIDKALSLDYSSINVVIGHEGERIQKYFNNDDVRHSNENYDDIQWIWQYEQKGTGHAVKVAVDAINNEAAALVLFGDVPLITTTLLHNVEVAVRKNHVALVTADMHNPGALGRIIRDEDNDVVAIREFKDANESERKIKEINSGILAVPGQYIKQWLSKLNNNNAQGEYYLTDLIAMAVADNVTVEAVLCDDETEVMGVNSLLDLQMAERQFQKTKALKLLESGCYIVDVNRFDIRGTLSHGKDCRIDVNCIFEGDCCIGDGVTIGANCILTDAVIGNNSQILPNTMVDKSTIGRDCVVGPYARIRPQSELKDESKVGNFVELKKTVLGQQSKINHLSYVGDAVIGKNVNIGAGVITCNYDGVNKHQTQIGDNAFIGSDCQLVAPVTIGSGSTIAAGTTVYDDAPENQLTLNKKNLVQIEGWTRPKKK